MGREEVFPVFLLLTPSSKGIRVRRGRKWKRKELRIRFCTPLRNFQGRAAQERPSAGPHPCNAAHEPCHRAGKLFLSIYSPPSFFLTPPTNKGRGCHSPKKTSGGIQNFFGTPSPSGAAAAFLVNLSRSISGILYHCFGPCTMHHTPLGACTMHRARHRNLGCSF